MKFPGWIRPLGALVSAVPMGAILCFGLATVGQAQDLEALKKRLADPEEKARRSAVEELSRRNGPEALALVLQALRDPSAMVADEAQVALGNADEEPEFELLFSKEGLASRDEWVRLRCAEALGRIQAKLSSQRLLRVLGDKDARVRRTLVHAVERLAARLDLLESPPTALRKEIAALAERDPVGGVRAAALMALATLEPGLTAAELSAWASDKSYEVRSAALLAASEFSSTARASLGTLGLKDAHPSVRLQAVRLLEKLADRQGATLLAAALENEKEPRLSWSTVHALRRLSGLRHGRDPRPWKQWAAALAEDWKPGQPAAGEGDPEPQTASFAGLPLLSERVTFLIDLSGSMWEEREGKTRKAGAERELERSLRALAPSTAFNVIPYTLTPLPWQAKLMPASPKNVAAALAFFVKRSDRGKGNFWDAMQLALADPEVDTLVMLGDGAPTGGTRWNVELMRTLFAEENRFRRVSLNAVLVDCPKGLARTWTAWCEESGGRVLSSDLR
jgi:HEAT repeat protein